jgi:hypothetical protein
MKTSRRRTRGESYKEKATRRKLQVKGHEKKKKLLYKEKATRRKLQGEGYEETAT